ncbi:replication/maintenance protein RepL [Planomicrobium sp. YIM 101495]|uniref:replication/maintenance protein RepL n=1 Tax=Planomicrobium sp. YIM 101495 TaxID=2665160 RepID=UPI0012B81910|nr:replication/maintenance protein RepL [Planomicrobium sp. YIM 101495]MTD30517.1 hypothetical protein [Planomicrobium sp. YIM 101495]
MLSLKKGPEEQLRPFTEQKIISECTECFAEGNQKLYVTAENFIHYFLEHASDEGVLFKTIREITEDLNIPHQTLTKVLKTMEKKQIIYRRNGIIGLVEL